MAPVGTRTVASCKQHRLQLVRDGNSLQLLQELPLVHQHSLDPCDLGSNTIDCVGKDNSARMVSAGAVQDARCSLLGKGKDVCAAVVIASAFA